MKLRRRVFQFQQFLVGNNYIGANGLRREKNRRERRDDEERFWFIFL